MQLRKIELTGFKSFADRTEFVFDGGVTAIVGPNGCGKSNVVDAVRWVLGEQSPKSLRAGSMGDCIFSGTATRKPLGYAEVTVLFDNCAGTLPVEQDEVALTRRIYGSGEGQYFVNRKPCRLRDIRELLAGTGVGTTAYSIIEQGEIGRIISSDPKELRAVFDEAAGISLYKARLRLACAKLERVTQNLLRVGDILSEVEKRLRSVKYQAAKARRFRETSQRLSELKLRCARSRYATLSGRRDELTCALEDRREEAASFEKDLLELDTRSELASTRFVEIERQIETFSADLHRLEKETADLNFTIELSGERIGHHRQNRRRLLDAADKGRTELEAAGALAADLEGRKGGAERRAARLSRLTAALAARENELSSRERSLADEASAAEAGAIEALRAAAALNNRLSEIGVSERGAAHQMQRSETRRDELTGLCAELEGKRRDLVAEKEALSAEKEHCRKRLAGLLERKKAAAAVREQLEKALAGVRGRLAALVSRRDLLVDLQRRREGVSEAARSLLEMDLPGTHGLVADLVNVPAHLALPVEGLLGENAEAVVVDTNSAALEAARRLRAAGSGRARIVSLERARAVAAAAPVPPALPFASVADGVSCREDCGVLVRSLLGDAFLAESLERALAANGSSLAVRIATPEGEVLDRDGSLSAGAAGTAGGLIWRRAEIDRLSGAEGQIRAELETLERRAGEIAGEMGRLEQQEEALEKTAAGHDARIARVQAVEAGLEARIEESRREIEVLASELTSLRDEISGFSAEREAVRAKMAGVQRESAELQGRIEQLKSGRREALGRLESTRTRHTRLEIALAWALEKQAQIDRRWEEAREAVREKAEALAEIAAEAADAQRLIAEENHTIRSAQLRLDTAKREANSAAVVLAARSRQGRTLREEVTRLAPALKEARRNLEEARTRLSELSVDHREVSVRLSDLVARAREELSVSPAQLEEPFAEVADEPALEDEIAALSKKLSSLGGVNMEALAELDELEARHAFLSGQRDDLVSARDSLEKLIAKTRSTSRKMFMESFESVREHFSNIFRRIFGGGKADCVLVDPSDVLESRIEIFAKPPGKELSTLTLLSGGEKAMTAVSLLFAMFSTRPSPFLVLDEVDAPMDESNIGRFIDLMRDFLPTSQFIVITHSRRTMSAADTLYGITMEELGVSKRVSLSFRNEAAVLEPVGS